MWYPRFRLYCSIYPRHIRPLTLRAHTLYDARFFFLILAGSLRFVLRAMHFLLLDSSQKRVNNSVCTRSAIICMYWWMFSSLCYTRTGNVESKGAKGMKWTLHNLPYSCSVSVSLCVCNSMCIYKTTKLVDNCNTPYYYTHTASALKCIQTATNLRNSLVLLLFCIKWYQL